MIFDLSTLHLGDVLLALPAMRAGDSVIARQEHRVPGAPVTWLDTGTGDVRPHLGRMHETAAWLEATRRPPRRHRLLPPAALRSGVVIAPDVRSERKRWGRWGDLRMALPGADVIRATDSRHWWMQVLAGAACVVCPDTGTAHMADALGVPKVVVLHGMGWPHYNRYRPFWNARDCIVRDTMDAITVEEVMGVVRA